MGFEMEFEEFEKEYMSNFGGYVPTYFTADEEFKKSGYIRINVEMIAPYRMTDGPSRFFRVISLQVNQEQYAKINEYAVRAGNHWKEYLEKKSEELLEYSNNFEG
jgi:hypothetical protein